MDPSEGVTSDGCECPTSPADYHPCTRQDIRLPEKQQMDFELPPCLRQQTQLRVAEECLSDRACYRIPPGDKCSMKGSFVMQLCLSSMCGSMRM